jgi:uncharacterized protein YacL (UPF0231 family)
MTAEDHLRNVIKNLNTHEHWTNDLHCAVRDAEAFLDREEIMISQTAKGIEKALELLDDMATLSPGGRQP